MVRNLAMTADPEDISAAIIKRDGDRIVVDVEAKTIDLLVDPDELARRRAEWKLPEPRYTTGVLAKYAKLAQGAERGAITG